MATDTLGPIEDRKSKREYFNDVVAKRVVKFVKLDDQIKRIQGEAREMVKRKKRSRVEAEKFIVDYLEKEGEGVVRLEGNALLTRKKISRKPPIRMKQIEECLFEYLGEALGEDSNRLIGDAMAAVDGNKGCGVRYALKRTEDR